MISFSPAPNSGNWSGSCWTVVDENQLAETIAQVALGQALHVQKILKGTGCDSVETNSTALQGARKLLTATNPSKPYHRDGWLFQTISWIAAHLNDPSSLKSAPHMIHAHKGFDGVQVGLNESNTAVDFVMICEDKATEGPRGMLTGQVWDELRDLDAGQRDNELIAETTTILAINSSIDAAQAVSKIFWENARRYRVAIATDEDHTAPSALISLFGGLENFPESGTETDRYAELLHKPDLRAWMGELAEKSIICAEQLTAATNV